MPALRRPATNAADARREQAAYERGVPKAKNALSEQLLRQRSELLELQNGVLASLRTAVPQVVRQSESALIDLAARSRHGNSSPDLPISREMVEAAVRSALDASRGTAEFDIHLHADDLALLQQANSPVLLPGPRERACSLPGFARGEPGRLPGADPLRPDRRPARNQTRTDSPIPRTS